MMKNILLSFLISTSVFGYCPKPDFTPNNKINIETNNLTIITHSSEHFDPLGLTAGPMNMLVAKTKEAKQSVLYFHDQWNSDNPHTGYPYDDCEPKAYVSSDIGHFKIDFKNVEHVLSSGGFYELCQNNTFKDAIKNWLRSGKSKTFKVTLVIDAIFGVGQDIRYSDSYNRAFRDHFSSLRRRHRKASVPLSDIVEIINNDEKSVDYLKRRLNWVSSSLSLEVDFLGKRFSIRDRGPHAKKLVVAYKYSTDPLFK